MNFVSPLDGPNNFVHPLDRPKNFVHPLDKPKNFVHPLDKGKFSQTQLSKTKLDERMVDQVTKNLADTNIGLKCNISSKTKIGSDPMKALSVSKLPLGQVYAEKN